MSKERESLGLSPEAVVGRYRVRHIHYCWGFYITYLVKVDGPAQRILLHELLPEELVVRAADGSIQGKSGRDQENFAWARDRFLREGRALAASTHPAIQKITEVFEANNTAYWVTPADESRDLKAWLERFGRAPAEAELTDLLRPLLSALQQLHAAGLCHLNLKFDTIRITPAGKPVLIHFAGARQDIARHSHESAAVTKGYSPIEQYDDAKPEGPWTDIYSLAAVLHRLIAGQLPPEATDRLTSDPYQKLAARFSGKYRADFLSAIDAALAPDPTARPQSIEGWRKMLGIPATATPGSNSKPVLARVCAAIVLAVITVGGWYLFRPKPIPLTKKDIVQDDRKDQKKKDEDQKKAEVEKKKADEEKKAEEAKAAEEKRKAEEQKLAEAEKKAEEESKAAEKAAEEKAAAAKQADETAQEKEAASKTAEQKAESETGDANEAAGKADAAKGAAKKKAAEKVAMDAAEKAATTRSEADKATADSAAANVAAKQAALDQVTAEKTAAEKDLAQKAIEQQLAGLAVDPKSADAKTAAQQAAAAKAGAEKTVAEKTAAEKAAAKNLAAAIDAQKFLGAKKVSGDNPFKEKSPAGKAAEEKAAVEKTAAEKAAAEKAATEKAGAEMVAKKAAEEKAAADKVAADKAAELAKKEHDNSSQSQNGPPPLPPSGNPGQVGSGLGGVWDTIQKGANGKPLKRLIIYPDTHFELITDSGTIAGFIQAKLGIMSMVADGSKDSRDSTFVYKNMSTIDTEGYVGKLEWTRVSANTPERNPQKGK